MAHPLRENPGSATECGINIYMNCSVQNSIWNMKNVANSKQYSKLNTALTFTVVFTKPPAEPFPALTGTIPEKPWSREQGSGLWGSFQPPAERWTVALWIALLFPANVIHGWVIHNWVSFLFCLQHKHSTGNKNFRFDCFQFIAFPVFETQSTMTHKKAFQTKNNRPFCQVNKFEYVPGSARLLNFCKILVSARFCGVCAR